MERKTVKIKSLTHLNHNVVQILTEKPKAYDFTPGQATEIAINKEGWQDKKRPFTFTSLPEDDDLQFTIKIYPSHDGVTEQIGQLNEGDEFIIGDAFGAITYKGKGTFLAGGAGVTPFIAIMKSITKNHDSSKHSLLFANKTKKDIFLEDYFEKVFGQNYINILSQEKTPSYPFGRIDKQFLKDLNLDLSTCFYICGPPKMTEDLVETLSDLGVKKNHIVTEDFDD